MPAPRETWPHAAASLLVLLAWALARPPAEPGTTACPAPREARCVAGWTVWVSCNPETAFRPLRGAASLLFGQRIDLNRAPPGVLEVLPGIGPARAAALAAERARRPFTSVADVQRVRGIGPTTAAGLEGWAEARPLRPVVADGCGEVARTHARAAGTADATRHGSQKRLPIASKSKRKQLQRASQPSPARAVLRPRTGVDGSPEGG